MTCCEGSYYHHRLGAVFHLLALLSAAGDAAEQSMGRLRNHRGKGNVVEGLRGPNVAHKYGDALVTRRTSDRIERDLCLRGYRHESSS